MTLQLKPEALSQILQVAQQAASDPTRFAEKYELDPVGFCREILGVTLWSKQKKLLFATLGAKRRIACRSGHGVGKSFVVACLVIWWLYARRGLVIVTAPTKNHLEDVIWREIHRLLTSARVPLPGERNKMDLILDHTWYASGVTTDQEGAFMGRHHPRLLLIGDEASELSEQTLLEMETCATGGENAIVLIGNPIRLSGTFYEAFKHPEMWFTMEISCLDHPNVRRGRELIRGAVTREWVERRRLLWGERHPLWFSRVLGQFPAIGFKNIVPLLWAEQACNDQKQQAELQRAEQEKIPRIAGLDVARYGDNLCVLVVRRGDAVESVQSWGHTLLTETAGRARRICKEQKVRTLIVDASGIGAGVYDMLTEENFGTFVLGYNGGHRAFNPGTYANRRTELWWHIRQRFEKGRLWLPSTRPNNELDPASRLVSDLVAPEYELSSAGRIKAESKEALLDRGVPSPDFADALTLCFAADEDPEAELAEPTGPQQDPGVAHERQELSGELSDFPTLPWSY